jgi:hypothetical protein
VGLIFEYDQRSKQLEIKGYAIPEGKELTKEERMKIYLDEGIKGSPLPRENKDRLQHYLQTINKVVGTKAKQTAHEKEKAAVYTKYKPVAQKVKPLHADLLDKYRIIREIRGDPLRNMPVLNPKPPDFKPTGRYTQERMEAMDKVHKGDFLWPEERKLVHHVIMEQEQAFAWDDSERGSFRTDFFPPIKMPVVEHTPWVYRNIPIPAGIYDEVCKIVQRKLEAGVYEPSNASYRSRWFTVAKKDGKSLRIVHSLEPLNAVTIAHSGVPPATEELASKYAGRACGGMFDLYVGYDERLLDPASRDMTTFQTPYGALRLVTLPMGWTNSVPIFHEDVVAILKAEIPDFTTPYIDDVPLRGPSSRYEKPDGTYETIPENKGIRRFVWEHINNANRILQRMKYCRGTFSGKKTVICAEEIQVLGHLCGYDGRKPTEDTIGVILRWKKCDNISDVRSFLGITGVLRSYIPNYGIRASALQRLRKKDVKFVWGPDQIKSMELLKEGVMQAKAIRPLDYEGQGAIVLAVDSSYIGIGYYIYQEDINDPKKCYYAKFGSKTMNDREARFSQPKRELFGMKEALRLNKRMLFGARKLVVETDAKYIKGMLQNPDMMPTATINRWIDEILMFQFTLRHKAGATFGPDGLSRRPMQEGDPIHEPCSDDEEEKDEEIDFEVADPNEPPPLDIKEFVDQIDTRHGFLHNVAESLDNFATELREADVARNKERIVLQKFLERKEGNKERVQLVQQLVNALALPEITEVRGKEQPYHEGHRSPGAIIQDDLMIHIELLLRDKSYRPEDMEEKIYQRIQRLKNRFLMYKEKIYRRGIEDQHRLYVPKEHRTYMMTAAHDHNGHRGFFGTRALLAQRFWWPEMEKDINLFVKTCHPCQERQQQLVRIPPVQTRTPGLFEVMHADIMHMTPASNGCKYVIQGREAVISWVEGRALRDEKARTIALWMYEDILCRWGLISTIVTDNGSSFKAAAKWIEKTWGIKSVTISPYNSRANGKVERPHWDIRQMLYKATGAANTKQWYWFLQSVLWADRTSIRKRTGYSPYYMVTGLHPILPLDAAEATWMTRPPEKVMTFEEMIGSRARALAKHRIHLIKMRARIDQEKLKRLKQYEKDFKAVIKDYCFEPGDLVLVRNTAIESSLDKKMKPRYNGPMIVVRRNKGGSYILAEIDGSVWHQKVARFRVVPYFARERIELPEGILAIIDCDEDTLQRIEEQDEPDEDFSKDYLMEGVKLDESDEERRHSR